MKLLMIMIMMRSAYKTIRNFHLHISRIENIRHPKHLLHYRPIGGRRRRRRRRRRRPGRPLKRPVDGYNRENETGHLLA
jgi:hypothetical protein